MLQITQEEENLVAHARRQRTKHKLILQLMVLDRVFYAVILTYLGALVLPFILLIAPIFYMSYRSLDLRLEWNLRAISSIFFLALLPSVYFLPFIMPIILGIPHKEVFEALTKVVELYQNMVFRFFPGFLAITLPISIPRLFATIATVPGLNINPNDPIIRLYRGGIYDITLNLNANTYTENFIRLSNAIKVDNVAAIINDCTVSGNTKINVLNTSVLHTETLMSMAKEFWALKIQILFDCIDRDLKVLQLYLLPLLQGHFQANNDRFANLNKDLLVKILAFLMGENIINITKLLSHHRKSSHRLIELFLGPGIRPMLNYAEPLIEYEKSKLAMTTKHAQMLLQPNSKLMLWFANRTKVLPKSITDLPKDDVDDSSDLNVRSLYHPRHSYLTKKCV